VPARCLSVRLQQQFVNTTQKRTHRCEGNQRAAAREKAP
jgi:hypothetical protein